MRTFTDIKDTKYLINNFIYHELPNGNIVVQTRKGIVKINQHMMIDFIKKIDDQLEYTGMTKQELSSFFGNAVEEAIAFLQQYQILEESKVFNYKVDNISYFSNNDKFLDMISFVMNDDLEEKGMKADYHNDMEGLSFKQNSLICCFLNPYDRELSKEIVKKAQDSNCILLMSYTYNHNLYIDNLYRADWKNPCHLCNMGNLETQLRMQVDGNITYQQIIDSVYQEDYLFKVETPLNNKNLLEMVSQISKTIDTFILRDNGFIQQIEESAYHINESVLINVNTNSVTRDFSIHWELCDCYE